MDPNETLDRIRDITTNMMAGEASDADVDLLPELVEALDQWITRGGFLPRDWQRTPAASR